MTNRNEPYAFKIYEKISFRQGEEVDDLYSISIDPEVDVIQEANYIQLRGVLMVSGDYQTVPKKEPLYIVDDEEENVVQQVRALDNGFMTFQYPIPVDITIPAERVHRDHEVEVKVDYFDYELPEPHTLNIQSSIRIDGIVEREVEEEYSEQSAVSDFELKEFPTFQEQEESQATESQPVQADHDYSADHEIASTPDESVEADSANEEPDEKEKGRDFWKKDKSQTFAEFFDKKEAVKNEVEEKKEEKVSSEKKDTYKEDNYNDGYHGDEDYDEDYDDDDFDDYEVNAMENEEEHEPDQKEKKPASGLSYLSKFFRSDEPTSSQVKVRFVQKNESLESIAEKYNLPSSKLERMNNLDESTALEEGDVIYVPQTEKK